MTFQWPLDDLTATCHLILFQNFHIKSAPIVPSISVPLCPSQSLIVMSLPKSTLSHCLSAPPGMSYTPISQTSGFEASTQASILVTGPDKPKSEGLRELDETIRTIKAYLSTRHYECSVELRVDQKSRHFRQATPVCRQDWCEIRLRQRRYPVHSRNAHFYPSKLEFSCRVMFQSTQIRDPYTRRSKKLLYRDYLTSS